MRRRALITGITGQDGSYLAELLLHKGYEVFGLVRRNSSFQTWRLDHLHIDPESPFRDRLKLVYGDLTDGGGLHELVKTIQPHEVYNLGAQSNVRVSFEIPELTADVTAIGTLRLLEAIRANCPDAKFYQASSSELFGFANPPQDENTPFHPRSPYGAAKLYSHWISASYRNAYGMFVASGILFNHESPRRGETFVTRKISRGVARIRAGLESTISLGNLLAVRDWGYAPEYVVAMWRMLQSDEPEDFVIGTGVSISVEEFVDTAFSHVGLNWRDHVQFEERLLRPVETGNLVANSSLAEAKLGWKAETSSYDLARLMVSTDIEFLEGRNIDKVHSTMWLLETS